MLPIRLYQLIHPFFFRGVCRFQPTCSQYAIEALRVHGPFKGFYLAVFRVLRCNPFCKGGYDPVAALPLDVVVARVAAAGVEVVALVLLPVK